MSSERLNGSIDYNHIAFKSGIERTTYLRNEIFQLGAHENLVLYWVWEDYGSTPYHHTKLMMILVHEWWSSCSHFVD